MIRYKDLPSMVPPAEDTVKAIEETALWLNEPGGYDEPTAEISEQVSGIGKDAKTLMEEIKQAYVERVSDKEDNESTMETYFKRLRQINDTATLFAAVNVAGLSREHLLGIKR